MSEVDDPFKAFKEGQPPSVVETENQEAPGKKKVRKKAVGSKRAGPANGGVPDAAPATSQGSTESSETRTRTRRKSAGKPRKARELKLGLSTLLDLGGLNDAENSALVAIATNLNSLPKKSRGRVSAALSKIFG